MAAACTYTEIWRKHDELRDKIAVLRKEAYLSDLTLAQYAGTTILSELIEDLEELRDESEGIASEHDRHTFRSAVNEMLYVAEIAYADALLYERDPKADTSRYCSSK